MKREAVLLIGTHVAIAVGFATVVGLAAWGLVAAIGALA